MKLFLAVSHSPNPFDLKAALLAGHEQHPVIIHFPIALFIASAIFELLAVWRKQPVFATVAYYNLLGAALTVPLAIATGLGAGMRSRLRAKGIPPRVAYFAVTLLALMVITLTGHLGGILSGVETP
jgi:uncharacterized membrane protein